MTTPYIVYRKTVRGVGALALREIIAFPISILAGILLARLLTPQEFGSFSTALFLVSTLVGMTEVGLRMTIIQQKDEPRLRELRTFFSLRVGLVGGMLLLLWSSAPYVAALFRLGENGAGFLRFLGLSLVPYALAAGSHVLLTRRLAYPTLATIELVQGLTYQGLAVLLAWKGYGLLGLGIAHLIAVSLRPVLLFKAAPWPIGFAWDRGFLKRALSYGGQVHLSALTSLLRDNIAVLLAGPLFGPQAVGYLNWATKMVLQVSQLFANIVTHVSFPSLSRVQTDSQALSQMMNAILRYVNLLTLPFLATLCALAPEVVQIIFTDKWAPAIPALYLMAVRMASGNLVTPLDTVLKATGRAGASLKIASLWTALEWLLCVVAVSAFGFVGVAAGYALGGWIAAIWFLLVISRFCELDLRYCLLRPAVVAAASSLVLIFVKGTWITDLPSLLAAGSAGVLLPPVLLLAWERSALVSELKFHLVFIRRALATRT